MTTTAKTLRYTLEKAILAELKKLALALTPECDSRKISFLHIIHKTHAEASSHCFDQPLIALTVQGRKRIQAGSYEFRLEPGSLLVTSVDMPSISTLIDVSHASPYLGFYVRLDSMVLADLMPDLPAVAAGYSPSAWAEAAGVPFLDVFMRLASAIQAHETPILAELLVRELHCMLLLQPQSGMLRQLYMNGGRDSRINDVIGWLRQNIASPASMAQLAKMANMSVSSFHRHFKSITGLSPLQYHKRLRLYEAQRLMLGENQRAADAALAVGYESVTQFNREYRRMFGEPPRRDVAIRKQKLSG